MSGTHSPPGHTISPQQLFNINTATVQEHYPKPLVAQGQDWTKNLIHLAKTAELKKHALTLQLHTAHILSAHARLDSKRQDLQDVKEQRNRVESERSRILDNLAQINRDRDALDLSIKALDRDCDQLRSTIQFLQDGDYAATKREVDALRDELGQPALPSLQSILDDKAATYLTSRRLKGPSNPLQPLYSSSQSRPGSGASPPSQGTSPGQRDPESGEPPLKRPRGRPKGSKNKPKSQNAYLGSPT